MSDVDVKAIVREVEALLACAGELAPEVELAVEKLLNVVETLCGDKEQLAAEIQRLQLQLDQKKKAKTTASGEPNDDESDGKKKDHSSEKRRRPLKPLRRKQRDRRSGKDLKIHETIECPVDPEVLPPDAVRVDDEIVVVQDINIEPRNIQYSRHTYYSPTRKKFIRGPLPAGHDQGDFGADLRALIVSLKYVGGMSEPKIRELLEHFDVQVSSGSVSNILTKTADSFVEEFDEIVAAGLASTPYQQTDDTSARVNGQFWHTHILCNEFYAAYFTRPRKDRLTLLEILQNTSDLRFRFGAETLQLLNDAFTIPQKWRAAIEAVGEQNFDRESLALLLDGWFGEGNTQLRTAIEQASAIVFYRHQTSLPPVSTIVCDDAGQFKLLTERLALCWIHAGRHYEKLSPVVPRHASALESFIDRFWAYYRSLREYQADCRAGPNESRASPLRLEFDELFSTRTGYEALDDRIAKTASKKDELLTVLLEPRVPLHNNASELQARVSARRRDVSLHSRSERGARAMDIFTTIVQTSKLLGIGSYNYLRDRIGRHFALPSLAATIQTAAQNQALNEC